MKKEASAPSLVSVKPVGGSKSLQAQAWNLRYSCCSIALPVPLVWWPGGLSAGVVAIYDFETLARGHELATARVATP